MTSNGAQLYVCVGGKGPAVVMLHGFGDTGDMWAPLARAMAKDHTVIVPDLRGMGLSSLPKGGYDKKTQGQDIAAVMDALKVQKADLVTHDIGNMVGYALAAQYPDRVTKWVVIDAPLPGIGPWEEILKSPLLWHFNFRGPDVDRLVKGRERIYLDRFYNELSANPKSIDEATRDHYARLYARPGNMHYTCGIVWTARGICGVQSPEKVRGRERATACTAATPLSQRPKPNAEGMVRHRRHRGAAVRPRT